eukprot:g15.t1
MQVRAFMSSAFRRGITVSAVSASIIWIFSIRKRYARSKRGAKVLQLPESEKLKDAVTRREERAGSEEISRSLCEFICAIVKKRGKMKGMSSKEVDRLVGTIRSSIATTLGMTCGRALLRRLKLSLNVPEENRDASEKTGSESKELSSSWHVVEEEKKKNRSADAADAAAGDGGRKSTEKTARTSAVPSKRFCDQLQNVSVGIVSLLLRNDAPFDIIRENISRIFLWFAYSGREDRRRMILSLRDAVRVLSASSLRHQIPLLRQDDFMAKLNDLIERAASIDVIHALSAVLNGEMVMPNAQVDEVELIHVFSPDNRKAIQFADCKVGVPVLVRCELLGDDHMMSAVVSETAKRTSSFWSGTKETCKVRFLSGAPDVLVGADPKAEKAKLTVLATIPLPFGKRKARIQVSKMRTHIGIERTDIFGGDGEGVCMYVDPLNALGASTLSDDNLEMSVVFGINGVLARASALVRLVTSGFVSSSKWDATYNIKNAEFRGGRLRVPIRMYVCEKTGIRVRVDPRVSMTFTESSGPDFEFVGSEAEAKQYRALTSLASTMTPRVMDQFRGAAGDSVRKAIGGKDICLLPWDVFDNFLEKLRDYLDRGVSALMQ